MKYKLLLIAIVLGSTCYAQYNGSNEEREYKRLGLTQKEWSQYKQSGMSKRKLKKLLSAGISLSEYFKKPWIKVGISEDEWVRLCRKGLTREEIAMRSEKAEYEGGIVLISFFLPGYGHFKMKETGLGFFFSGGAVVSGGLVVVGLANNNGGVAKLRPLFIGMLLTDMIVSAADVWRKTKFDDNPDLRRFSIYTGANEIGLSMKF